MDFETIQYAVDDAVAVITLARPGAANALSSLMIDEIDRALDLAEADDDVRVVVLAGEGKHFSSGHDLKEILEERDDWALMRRTPEGKWEHERVMFWDRSLRLRDFPKPTIASVHGAVAAAGFMLACMCDLIVAADDTRFSNLTARMTGVGVELLVEPWEFGPRKAKEFLWCAETWGAEEAERLGLVNKVVPLADLEAATRAMADKVAMIEPITARSIKETINHTMDRMGQVESWKYHFLMHQMVSNTATALGATEKRRGGGMDAVKREQAGS
jgi:enoyl-CoA hydratase